MSTPETSAEFEETAAGDYIIEPVEGTPLDLETTMQHTGLVSVIGQHSLLESRNSDHSDEEPREHHLVHLNVGGFRQTVWITEPAPGHTLQVTVASKPGLGEIIEDGIGWEFHRELAHKLPNARVLSHATYGFGPTAEQIPWRQLTKHNLGRLAIMGIDLLATIPEDAPLVLAGTSLGTVINNKLLYANLHRPKPVAIDLVVHHAPALVVPSRIIPDMVVGLPPGLVVDIFRELTLKSDPKRFRDNLRALRASKPSLNDILPTVRLFPEMAKGTRLREIEEVVANYQTVVIEGTKDSVAEIKMWQELAQKYPDNLSLHLIPGRGHGLTIKPREKARKIANIITAAGIF